MVPSALISRMIWKIFRTTSGARPSEGSSRSSSLGRGHEGAADGEHLLFAAGEGAGLLVARSRRTGKSVKHAFDVGGDAWSCRGAGIAPSMRFSRTVRVGEDLAAFGDVGDAHMHDFVRREADQFRGRGCGLACCDDGGFAWPVAAADELTGEIEGSQQIDPSAGRSKPLMERRSVVFPAPLEPIRVTISPRSMSRETSWSARMPP